MFYFSFHWLPFGTNECMFRIEQKIVFLFNCLIFNLFFPDFTSKSSTARTFTSFKRHPNWRFNKEITANDTAPTSSPPPTTKRPSPSPVPGGHNTTHTEQVSTTTFTASTSPTAFLTCGPVKGLTFSTREVVWVNEPRVKLCVRHLS